MSPSARSRLRAGERLALCFALISGGIACAGGLAPAPPRAVALAPASTPPLVSSTGTVAAPWPKLTPPCDPAALTRDERRVTSTPGIEIFVTRVAAPQRRGVVVLTHGAGSPSSAIWDLLTPGYSVQRHLACRGFDTYALDVRGFGGSTKPKRDTMVRALDVVPDVAAVIALAQRETGLGQVDLLGWSWGSDVAAATAGQHPQWVRRLVLIAPVYDRRWPTRHSEDPKWRKVDRVEFDKYFDPVVEERVVLDEHLAALFRFADEGGELWLPSGPYRDLYGPDAPVWDPRLVVAPTLIVRGEKDPASQPEPVARLGSALGATTVVAVELPGEGHFPFRTKRHQALLQALDAFLSW